MEDLNSTITSNNVGHEYPIITTTNYQTPQNAVTVKVKKDGQVVDNIKLYLNGGKSNTLDNDDKNRQQITTKKRTKNFQKAHPVRAKVTIMMLIVIFAVFLMSVTGFFIMWFTEMYNDSLLSNLVYLNNTTALKWWMNPPLDPQVKVYVFNYTNTDRFLSGKDKVLKVQELGPYVYVEKLEKVNITFNENATISYQERRTLEFLVDLSVGKQYDRVVIPNIPMLTASATVRDAAFMTRFTVSSVLSATNSRPFKELGVYQFLWGYDDPLLDLSKKFSKEKPEMDKFGMLSGRNGTSKDILTIFNGEDDIRKIAIFDTFNGNRKLNFWGTDECNRIDGTDGSQFPPYLMNKKHSLQVFIKSFCRKFSLLYHSEVNLFDGIPAWRYKAPLNTFSHPDLNPENQCYCEIETGRCPPTGIFNSSQCFKAPIVISFPHFFTGEEKLFKNIVGLHPNESKHLTYADVHPRLAFPIDGASRFQINVQVQKASIISDLNNFEDNQILPVIWMEVVPGELSQELKQLIYHSTFTSNVIELYLRYGTLSVALISLLLLVITCCYQGKGVDKDKHNGQHPSSGKEFDQVNYSSHKTNDNN